MSTAKNSPRTLAVIAVYLASAATPMTSAAQATVECSSATTKPEFTVALDKAMQQRSANKLAEAEVTVGQVLAKAPNNPRALYSLGMIRTGRQDFALAEETLGRAITIRSQCGEAAGVLNPNIYNNLGWVQLQQGKFADAQKTLNKAITVKGMPAASRTRALSNLGYAYFITGDFDRAKPVLEQAVAERSVNAAYTLGLLNNAQAKVQESKQKARLAAPSALKP